MKFDDIILEALIPGKDRMKVYGKRKLGRGVAIVGAGMSHFGVRKELTNRELFLEAFVEMQKSIDKDFDTGEIDCVYIGNAGAEFWEAQTVVSVLCADAIGVIPRPTAKIEDACASSSVALREGIIAIASGIYDVVLVGGTEKMSSLPTELTTMAIATGADTIYESAVGYTFPGLYGTLASAHMHEYGTTRENLFHVAIKNHQNGVLNPKSHLRMSIKDVMAVRQKKIVKEGGRSPEWRDEVDFLNDVTANPIIAWPNALFDCCPTSDGAASILLAAEEIAQSFTEKPIYIIGTGHASDYPLHGRRSLTSLEGAKGASAQAYEMASVRPKDIRIAEVHDCFTIAEICAIADVGFFREGADAAHAAEEGKTSRCGIKPVNVSGGLKCKGHPVGATGAAQVVEIFEQMRGEAGERQLPGDIPHLGLTHNIGAHGTTAVIHIFERR